MFLSKIYGFFKRHKDVRNESVGRNVPLEHRTRRASDSDRRYVGMLEERMAFEQNCDWASGSRNAQKSFSKQLIDAAKELGIYISKPQAFIMYLNLIHANYSSRNFYRSAPIATILFKRPTLVLFCVPDISI